MVRGQVLSLILVIVVGTGSAMPQNDERRSGHFKRESSFPGSRNFQQDIIDSQSKSNPARVNFEAKDRTSRMDLVKSIDDIIRSPYDGPAISSVNSLLLRNSFDRSTRDSLRNFQREPPSLPLFSPSVAPGRFSSNDVFSSIRPARPSFTSSLRPQRSPFGSQFQDSTFGSPSSSSTVRRPESFFRPLGPSNSFSVFETPNFRSEFPSFSSSTNDRRSSSDFPSFTNARGIDNRRITRRRRDISLDNTFNANKEEINVFHHAFLHQGNTHQILPTETDRSRDGNTLQIDDNNSPLAREESQGFYVGVPDTFPNLESLGGFGPMEENKAESNFVSEFKIPTVNIPDIPDQDQNVVPISFPITEVSFSSFLDKFRMEMDNPFITDTDGNKNVKSASTATANGAFSSPKSLVGNPENSLFGTENFFPKLRNSIDQYFQSDIEGVSHQDFVNLSGQKGGKRQYRTPGKEFQTISNSLKFRSPLNFQRNPKTDAHPSLNHQIPVSQLNFIPDHQKQFTGRDNIRHSNFGPTASDNIIQSSPQIKFRINQNRNSLKTSGISSIKHGIEEQGSEIHDFHQNQQQLPDNVRLSKGVQAVIQQITKGSRSTSLLPSSRSENHISPNTRSQNGFNVSPLTQNPQISHSPGNLLYTIQLDGPQEEDKKKKRKGIFRPIINFVKKVNSLYFVVVHTHWPGLICLWSIYTTQTY